MLGVWNEILVGLQHVRAIAHRRQVLDLLPKDLTRSAAKGPYPFCSSFFHRQSRGPCQRWSRPLARANIEIFFSDERTEFIDFDEGADFGLWWAGWECLGSLDQPARDRLVVDPENSADRSHPHPFEIELTGLLLKGWIFASS